jgi:hypothetical protein
MDVTKERTGKPVVQVLLSVQHELLTNDGRADLHRGAENTFTHLHRTADFSATDLAFV